MMMTPGAPVVSPLAVAWRHTGVFWSQTLIAFVRHPLAILACAAIPAIERCYVKLHGTRLGRGRIAALELLVTVCRVILCAVAVWAACSGRELRALTAQMGAAAAWQMTLENVGAYLSHQVRAVLLEILFLVVVLLLAEKIVCWLVSVLSRRMEWLRENARRQAALSLWRNLILFPVTLVYLVEMVRPGLQ